MSCAKLAAAATEVLRAVDASRDAMNGLGHPGEPHDTILARVFGTRRGIVDDCAACGGAQYGTDDDLNCAHGALRVALGQPRKPWEGVDP